MLAIMGSWWKSQWGCYGRDGHYIIVVEDLSTCVWLLSLSTKSTSFCEQLVFFSNERIQGKKENTLEFLKWGDGSLDMRLSLID